MARALTPQDGCALMTAVVRQATGQANLASIDTSNFVSAGETVLATGKENVFNALTIVLGRTLAASRPYRAKLRTINALNTGIYTFRLRKISYYAKDPVESGWFNTDQKTNFADGYNSGDNGGASTKSQWEQHQAMPLEMNFAGGTTWQNCITLYEDKLEQAFRDVNDFNTFITGILTEHANDIESQKEGWNRLTLNNAILARYQYDAVLSEIQDGAVNLTTRFNSYFGTNYTSAALRTTYLEDFVKFMVATIQEFSDHMEERGTAYHNPMTQTVGGVNYSILRHTPKDRQRLYLFTPLLRHAQTQVMPTLFNPEYLDINNYEGVEFWQSNASDTARPSITGIPSYYDSVTGTQVAAGSAITLEYVVGVLMDQDAVMTDFQLERATVTPLEARKGYRNSWLTFLKNAINDPTENMIVFYMDDSGVTP